jgi:Zn-dependent M16 (insulinase) family peptidase
MRFQIPDTYRLIRKETLSDIGSEGGGGGGGYILEHVKSGARIMLIANSDDNKVFNIVFRTTPKDSCGEAHIIEHTVLCGSRKYPSKDPFVELVKGSMNTFLNAMTYPDKTMFPVASTNDTDFKNLMDVYLDAVFYPNIYKNENIFRQEGWSFQIEKPEDPIVYNGVVYNEMKGAYSSPDDVCDRLVMNSLFPDTTYGVDSGGMPEHIPELTYEQFLNFHRTYYHPSNSYIYLYGDLDFEERLKYLDEAYLSRFERTSVSSEVKLQKPFSAPIHLTEAYPVGAEEPLEKHTYLTRNTVIGQSTDSMLCVAMDVLEDVLLEAPGAPLKMALLDAGIGTDVYGSFDSSIRQPVFSVTAKNADEADSIRFEEIIASTLAAISEKGLNPKEIEASINSMEFRYREADYGGFPKGLIYSINVFDSWLYDEEKPFEYLRQQAVFKALRERIGTGYFEDLIRKYLMNNPHTSYVSMKPERGLTQKVEEATEKKLAELKASLSGDQIEDLIRGTKELRRFQETPSTQEELEKIPILKRSDLGRSARPFSNIDESRDGIRLIRHDYQTNGIVYVTVLFDLAGIAQEDLPYLGILRNVLGEVDTEHYSYRELATEIGRRTGGVTPGVSLFTDPVDADLIKGAFGMQIATLPDEIDFALEITGEILLTSKFSDRKRMREIIQKLRSRLSVQLTSSGHATAAQRCLSYFSPAGVFNDGIGGISLYHVVCDLEEHFDERYEELCRTLERLLGSILKNDRMLTSYTGSSTYTGQILAGLRKLSGQLGDGKSTGKPDDQRRPFGYLAGFETARKNEGFRTPGKIQYVAEGGRFPADKATGALSVLKVIMNYDYLWQNLRVVGGAYGCGGSFTRSGTAVFYSYRDPHLRNTLRIYEGIPEYLETFDATERDMTKFVIGTISDFDTPLTPRIAGTRSMNAFISGLTYEQVQQERNEVLAAQPSDIRALAPLMREALSGGALCVIGSESKIDESRELFQSTETLS